MTSRTSLQVSTLRCCSVITTGVMFLRSSVDAGSRDEMEYSVKERLENFVVLFYRAD